MSKNRILSIILTLLVTLGLVTGAAAAQSSKTQLRANPLGTAFTYQGQLRSGGGTAINDICAFNFSLWDSDTGGQQIGETQNLTGVAVSGGLFTVQLDFGSGVFDGNARWLEIAVECPSDSGFTTLSPRQPLTPAPYAFYSLNSAQLGGLPASSYQQHYANVLVVAKSGGDFTTLTAALNSINDASDTNRYLISVAPGVYTERVTMIPYVDIQGSGEATTKIAFNVGSTIDNAGTVMGADNAELRNLTVENTGGDVYDIAIYNSSASPSLSHVTASSPGSSGTTSHNVGIENSSSSPVMMDVNVTSTGGTVAYGIWNVSSSSPIMTNINISAKGGASSVGMYNQITSSPVMTDMTVTASGGTYNYGVWDTSNSAPVMLDVNASASGGTIAYGVYNNSSSPTLTNVTATASNGTTNYGVMNYISSPTMTNMTVTASGGTNNVGVKDSTSSNPTITNINAIAKGGTNTNYGMDNNASSSSVIGGSISCSGGSSCIALYNEAGSSLTLKNASLSAGNGTTSSYGIYNTGGSSSEVRNCSVIASVGESSYGIYSYNGTSSTPANVRIYNSQVAGNTNSISIDQYYSVYVGASMLDPAVTTNHSGSISSFKCVDSFNPSLTELSSTCQ